MELLGDNLSEYHDDRVENKQPVVVKKLIPFKLKSSSNLLCSSSGSTSQNLSNDIFHNANEIQDLPGI